MIDATARSTSRAAAASGRACRTTGFRALTLAALALLLAACQRDASPTDAASTTEPPAADNAGRGAAEAAAMPASGSLEAVALELGTTLDADGRVAVSTERVQANDTVHISLVTVGDAEAAMLAVRWRDAQGRELAADGRVVRAAGPAVHTFSRTPEGGWAPGRYEVEVMLGGASAGIRGFEVR